MQLRHLPWLATLGLGLLAGLAVSRPAASETAPPLVAVGSAESRMLADAADGKFDRLSLLRAALIAGGLTDEQELGFWQQEFELRCAPLDRRHEAGETFGPETLFTFLHSHFLTGGYQAAVTTLPATLGNGHYNCLTATTLLIALGDRYTTPLQAVSTSGHIYCRAGGPSPAEIETTCPEWFTAGHRAASLHTAERAAASRSINRVEMVAKFYYNRGLARLADKQFAAAIPLLQRSLQLDPGDPDARENLLAGLNNWALALAEAERFGEADGVLRRAVEIDAGYSPLAANELHIHQRWAAWHCARHEYQAAIDVLQRGRGRQPAAPLYRAGPRAIYAQWVAWHLARGEAAFAEKVLAAARGQLDREALASLEAHLEFALPQ